MDVTIAARTTAIQELCEASEEIASWKRLQTVHRQLHRNDTQYRGCVGLGMHLDPAEEDRWIERDEKLFVPDDDVTWFTLLDLPRYHWRTAPKRCVRLGTVCQTSQVFGMPLIGHQRNKQIGRYDLEVQPDSEAAEALSNDPLCLRIFNSMNYAMTSYAVNHQYIWRRVKKVFWESCGFAGGSRQRYLIGEECPKYLESPWDWMPVPYLAFHVKLAKLWERATSPAPGCTGPFLSLPLKKCFLDALIAGLPVRAPISGELQTIVRRQQTYGVTTQVIVIRPAQGEPVTIPINGHGKVHVLKGQQVERGQIIAHEVDVADLPQDWDRRSLSGRWEAATNLFSCFVGQIHLWWERQAQKLAPGYVHMPAMLISEAAKVAGAVEKHLWWDVSSGLKYFNQKADAFVYPPIPIIRWDDFYLRMADTTLLYLHPMDERFPWKPLMIEARREESKAGPVQKQAPVV